MIARSAHYRGDLGSNPQPDGDSLGLSSFTQRIGAGYKSRNCDLGTRHERKASNPALLSPVVCVTVQERRVNNPVGVCAWPLTTRMVYLRHAAKDGKQARC